MRFWILSECPSWINSCRGPVHLPWEQRWAVAGRLQHGATIPTSWGSQPRRVLPPWVWEQHATCSQPIEYDKGDGISLPWWHYFIEDAILLPVLAVKKQAAMSPMVPRTWILPKRRSKCGRGPFPSPAKMRSPSWLTPWLWSCWGPG